MKKRFFICLLFIVIFMICTLIHLYCLQRVDTKLAIKYSEVFGSYDIDKADSFLDKSASITYRGITKKYSDLRDNVIFAFYEKQYSMLEGSSYGHGDNRFIDGIQEVNIQSYVEFNNERVENTIEMEILRVGLNNFKVKSLKCDDEFFGYLFFGILDESN